MMTKTLVRALLFAWLIISLYAQLVQRPFRFLQQSTGTVSPTTTQSITPSTSALISETPTGTLTITVTGTQTLTGSPTLTHTLYSPTPSTTPTPTATTVIVLTASPIPSETQFTPTFTPLPAELSPTATLIPFPSLTMVFPEPTATQVLLSSERQPDDPAMSKGNTSSWWKQVLPIGAFLFLGLVWLGLGVWYVIVRRQGEK